MNKKEIITRLESNHQKFLDYLDTLEKKEFEYSKKQKWSAGQELEHIIKSTLPVSQILSNKELLKSKFGTINRNSISYEELISKYQNILANGGESTPRFSPDKIYWKDKYKLKNQLKNIIIDLCTSLNDYSENELTILSLPHPLIGKLSLRELFYFTIYHVNHHLENSKKNLCKVPKN